MTIMESSDSYFRGRGAHPGYRRLEAALKRFGDGFLGLMWYSEYGAVPGEDVDRIHPDPARVPPDDDPRVRLYRHYTALSDMMQGVPVCTLDTERMLGELRAHETIMRGSDDAGMGVIARAYESAVAAMESGRPTRRTDALYDLCMTYDESLGYLRGVTGDHAMDFEMPYPYEDGVYGEWEDGVSSVAEFYNVPVGMVMDDAVFDRVFVDGPGAVPAPTVADGTWRFALGLLDAGEPVDRLPWLLYDDVADAERVVECRADIARMRAGGPEPCTIDGPDRDRQDDGAGSDSCVRGADGTVTYHGLVAALASSGIGIGEYPAMRGLVSANPAPVFIHSNPMPDHWSGLGGRTDDVMRYALSVGGMDADGTLDGDEPDDTPFIDGDDDLLPPMSGDGSDGACDAFLARVEATWDAMRAAAARADAPLLLPVLDDDGGILVDVPRRMPLGALRVMLTARDTDTPAGITGDELELVRDAAIDVALATPFDMGDDGFRPHDYPYVPDVRTSARILREVAARLACRGYGAPDAGRSTMTRTPRAYMLAVHLCEALCASNADRGWDGRLLSESPAGTVVGRDGLRVLATRRSDARIDAGAAELLWLARTPGMLELLAGSERDGIHATLDRIAEEHGDEGEWPTVAGLRGMRLERFRRLAG